MTTDKHLLHADSSNRLYWFTKNSVLRLVNFLDPQDMRNYEVIVVRNGERLSWSIGHSGIYLQANDTVEIIAKEVQRVAVDICTQEIKIGDDWVSLGAVTLDAFARTTTLAVTQGFANSDGDPGYSLTPGDPLIPSMIINSVQYGNVSYELAVGASDSSGTTLNWTLPSTFAGGVVVPGTGPGAGTTHWPLFSLTLQRSAGSLNVPYSNLFTPPSVNTEYPFAIAVNTTASRTVQTFPDWANLHTWVVASVDLLPTTFKDTEAPNPNFNYRLILQMGPFNVAGHDAVAEVDWNVVSAVKSYTTFAGSNVNGQTTLSWTIPPGTAHFDIYRSTTAGTFPGSPTYANVSASVTTYGPITDSSLPVYYRLRATLANGLVVSFNDITVQSNTPGRAVWVTAFGAQYTDIGQACVTDSSGNIYFVAAFQAPPPTIMAVGSSNLQSGSSGFSWCLVKLDPVGSVATVSPVIKSFNSTSAVFPRRVALDSLGNIYVAGIWAGTASFGGPNRVSGSNFQNCFLAKYDSAGNWLWDVEIVADKAGTLEGLAIDSLDRVIISGNVSGLFSAIATGTDGGQIFFDNGYQHPFMMKVSTTGVLLTQVEGRTLGDAAILSGFAFNRTDDSMYWLVSLSGNPDRKMDIYVYPDNTSTGTVLAGTVAIKFNDTAGYLASKQFPGNFSASAVALDSGGNPIIAGEFFSHTYDMGGGTITGTTDVYTNPIATGVFAKYTVVGTGFNWGWNSVITGTTGNSQFQFSSLAVKLDSVYGVGQTAGDHVFGNIAVSSVTGFIFKAVAGGAFTWVTKCNGASPNNVALDAAGNPVVTGQFTATTDFGGVTKTSRGGFDIYVAKY